MAKTKTQKPKKVKEDINTVRRDEIKERKSPAMRRLRAEERQAERMKRTDKEQLERLDTGGWAATRERKRLMKNIGE